MQIGRDTEDLFDTVAAVLGAVAARTNFDSGRPRAINQMCIGEGGP